MKACTRIPGALRSVRYIGGASTWFLFIALVVHLLGASMVNAEDLPIAGGYFVPLSDENGVGAALHLRVRGSVLSGTLRLANGTRIVLSSTQVSAETTVAVGAGLTLIAHFDGDTVNATLSSPNSTLTGDGRRGGGSIPATLPGTYTIVLTAADGSTGWMRILIGKGGTTKLIGVMPDGSKVAFGEMSAIVGGSELGVVAIAKNIARSSVSGTFVFEDLPLSDMTANLQWVQSGIMQGCAANGAKYVPSELISLAAGSYTASMTGAGLNLSTAVELQGSYTKALPLPFGKIFAFPTTGMFQLRLRELDDAGHQIGERFFGSGVFHQKLMSAIGLFRRAGSAGNFKLEPVVEPVVPVSP